MCYESFVDFVEFFVIPQRNANPTHIRFDGKIAGGNRQVVGMFRHQGKTWKVLPVLFEKSVYFTSVTCG